jgi:hypothetical protein
MLKLSFLTLLLVSPIINAEEARSANAHVHGLNNLAMVINHNQIAITYEMPIVQLLEEHEGHDDHEEHEGHDDHEEHEGHDDHEEHEGHDDHEEHEGHDDHEEHEGHNEIMASNDSLAEFQNYLQLFAFPKGAKCDLVSFKSRLHSVSTEGGHKDVELSYEFSCNDPSQLNSLIINAFDRFSELETLNFEAVINNKALTKSLKSGNYKVIF